MKITLVAASPAEISVDALAIPISTGQRLSGAALELDRALGGVLSEMVATAEFRGRVHEVLPVPVQGKIAPRRVILYGLGAPHDLDGQRMRSAHHELVRASRTYGYKRLAVLRMDPIGPDGLKAVVEGCVMGTFERRSRHTGAAPERREIDELILVGFGAGREHEVVAAQENGEATNRMREWQNAPPNELTPDALAQETMRIALRHELEVEVLRPDELRSGGYNLLLGVGAGSAKPTLIGHAATAGVSNDDDFWFLVYAASREAGDRVWRLPMYADYRVVLCSQIADLRNSEYGEANSILGGMFISEFAGGKPWVHLDIAASSWNTNSELTTVYRGPSGAGTRICIELAELMAGAER